MDSQIIKPKSEVFLGDCMEFMKDIPDKYFELSIVDPPYGIGAGSENFKSGTRKRKSNFHKKNDWDLKVPDEQYFIELFRVSKNQIIWGANYMVCFLPISKGWIFWDKKTGDNSYGDGELAFTSFDRAFKKYELFWLGAHAKEKNELDRCHPTQKPIALYKWLLTNYAKSGDKILDTHLGSGSSRIAAYDLGFDFTGYELDADYFAASEKRFAEHKIKNGNQMFAPEPKIIIPPNTLF